MPEEEIGDVDLVSFNENNEPLVLMCKCKHCGDDVENLAALRGSNGEMMYLCDDCIIEYYCCDDCGHYHLQSSMQTRFYYAGRRTPGIGRVCNICFARNSVRCEMCNDAYSLDSVESREVQIACISNHGATSKKLTSITTLACKNCINKLFIRCESCSYTVLAPGQSVPPGTQLSIDTAEFAQRYISENPRFTGILQYGTVHYGKKTCQCCDSEKKICGDDIVQNMPYGDRIEFLLKNDSNFKNGRPVYSSRNVSVDTKDYGKPLPKCSIKIDRLVGCELEVEGGYSVNVNHILPRKIGIMRDGSIPTGVEIITNPASLDALEKNIRHVTKQLRDNNFYVNKRCGMHIHMDMSDLRGKYGKVSNVLKTYLLIEPMLFSILPPSRLTSKYCAPLRKFYSLDHLVAKNFDELERNWYRYSESFEEFEHEMHRFLLRKMKGELGSIQGERAFRKLTDAQRDRGCYKLWKSDWKSHVDRWKGNKYNKSRYVGVNFHSFFYRGTLEIRHHSGTLHTQKILNWININLAIVDYAIKRFNVKELEEFQSGALSELKFKKFCRVFGFDNKMYKYMVSRAKMLRGDKFNAFDLDKFDDENYNV